MRRPWLHMCLGISVSSVAMLMGCHSTARHCDSCNGKTAAAKMLPATTAELQPIPSTTSYHQLLPESVPASPMPSAPTETTQAEPAPVPDAVDVEQTGFADSLRDAKKELKLRRTYRDITAHPCFAHAADYSSVTGELYFDKETKTWTVRYASLEEDDKFGGTVTLTDMGPMDSYKSGQMVKVQGQIANTDNQESNPAFRVTSMHAVQDQAQSGQ